MILIKYLTKKIPSFRHKKLINIFDNSFIYKKDKLKYNKNLNLIKRKKQIYKSQRSISIQKSIQKLTLITKQIFYNFKPYKKFILCDNLTNFSVTIPGLEFLNVGKLLFYYDFFNYYKKLFFFKGIYVPLHKVPQIASFSNVSNIKNNKITFSKASGTFSKIIKSKKSKKKLISISLPSKKNIFLNKFCNVYLGKNINFRTNELVEGK
jgi:ribosomal protein L2